MSNRRSPTRSMVKMHDHPTDTSLQKITRRLTIWWGYGVAAYTLVSGTVVPSD